MHTDLFSTSGNVWIESMPYLQPTNLLQIWKYHLLHICKYNQEAVQHVNTKLWTRYRPPAAPGSLGGASREHGGDTRSLSPIPYDHKCWLHPERPMLLRHCWSSRLWLESPTRTQKKNKKNRSNQMRCKLPQRIAAKFIEHIPDTCLWGMNAYEWLITINYQKNNQSRFDSMCPCQCPDQRLPHILEVLAALAPSTYIHLF